MGREFKRISVIGLGYIGLPTAATIASRGVQVIGVDVNAKAVNIISSGKAHFAEPDLDILLRSTISTKVLQAVTEPEEADAFLIAVPTPIAADHSADLSYVEKACRAIAKVLQPNNLVILESTSPIGTTEKICKWIAEERADLNLPNEHPDDADIYVAHCPERILPGRMVMELVQNDRIIGGMTEACAERAADLYRIFVQGDLHLTNAHTAELVKLMENAYRDVNIAFANEISIICEPFDIDPWEAIKLANHHPRVNILNPGPGVGGHCIAVDPWFLISGAPDDCRLMVAARQVNDRKPLVILDRVRHQVKRFREPVIACLGLAYKPDVDDMRESPALEIVEALARDGEARLVIVEPNLEQLPAELADNDSVKKVDLADAMEQADIILLLVGHKEFNKVDIRKIYERIVIDTVGFWRSKN